MVFAFNCVTVTLILIELLRYNFASKSSFIKKNIDSFFKTYVDEREQKSDSLIVTHILLLMG